MLNGKWYFFEKKEHTHTKFNILYSRLHLIYFQNGRAQGNKRSTHISNWPPDKHYKQQIQGPSKNISWLFVALSSSILIGGWRAERVGGYPPSNIYIYISSITNHQEKKPQCLYIKNLQLGLTLTTCMR